MVVDPGSISDITIRDFTLLSATRASGIFGSPERALGKIKLEDISIESHEGGTTEDTMRELSEQSILRTYPSPRLLGALPAHGFYFRDIDGPVETKNVRVSTAAAVEERPQLLLERADSVGLDGFDDDVSVMYR